MNEEGELQEEKNDNKKEEYDMNEKEETGEKRMRIKKMKNRNEKEGE